MNYELFPPVQHLVDLPGECAINMLAEQVRPVLNHLPLPYALEKLPPQARPVLADSSNLSSIPFLGTASIEDKKIYVYYWGTSCPDNLCWDTVPAQGYRLIITVSGIVLISGDVQGFSYGFDTFAQILQHDRITCVEIFDYPRLPNRGLMLDGSRGKVYKLEFLKHIVEFLSQCRYNIFQLYTEHTFEFSCHPEISQDSGGLSATDVLELQSWCKRFGIELQANLQSFGHCNRILTRPEFQHLSESELYWTLSPVEDGSYRLLDDLYSEFLPLFESPYLNVCSDETYDLGQGKSASLVDQYGVGQIYRRHLLKLHELAAKYGKKIMVFGDIVVRHPELLNDMPDDIIYLDWIYDPKPVYETPSVFERSGKPFWICPGTGQWNSLFPRFDGAIMNIVGLTLEGMAHGATGMLLTDWNDHGGYAMQGFADYLYVYGGAVAWSGTNPGTTYIDYWADIMVGETQYSQLEHLFSKIYQLPPIWSKNRSECVMGLFDEPVFGNAVCGQEPPEGLQAYELCLPEGIKYVLERHAHHPLRPYFSIPVKTCETIRNIVNYARPLIATIQDILLSKQFLYIADAFDLLVDKLLFSRALRTSFSSRKVSEKELLAFEEKSRILIRRFVRLEIQFVEIWNMTAMDSEIEICCTYFSNIISRLDYLRDWLSTQRDLLRHSYELDYLFQTYDTAGYTTLPTY